jgi:hypothetical protein
MLYVIYEIKVTVRYVGVKTLATLVRIWEVATSILGLEVSYRDVSNGLEFTWNVQKSWNEFCFENLLLNFFRSLKISPDTIFITVWKFLLRLRATDTWYCVPILIVAFLNVSATHVSQLFVVQGAVFCITNFNTLYWVSASCCACNNEWSYHINLPTWHTIRLLGHPFRYRKIYVTPDQEIIFYLHCFIIRLSSSLHLYVSSCNSSCNCRRIHAWYNSINISSNPWELLTQIQWIR